MPISYIYAKDRRTSLIEDEDKTLSEPKGKPAAGFTADTRFFSVDCSATPKFIVKRPQYSRYFGKYCEPSLTEKNALDAQLKPRYERELELWNRFYPEKKAILFSNGGLRLVLPYLPGLTLAQTEISNRLIACQIALAIARAFKKLQTLKLYYTDLNEDNILIEKQADNSFEAHLIDFGGVGEVPCNLEKGFLSHFISKLRLKQNRLYDPCEGIDYLIQDLENEINTINTPPNIYRIFQAGGKKLFSRYVDGLREEADFSSWWHKQVGG